jgi:enoyl-CoA hydratase
MPRAKEYLFTGDRISAEVALNMGLVNRVVPGDELVDSAVEFATRLAALPPQALRSTKHALNIHLRRAAEGVLDYALQAEFESFGTAEHQAAVERFRSR